MRLTKDHLKYILSQKDDTKNLVNDKLFKKAKDLTQNQLDLMTMHSTIDYLK